eukprot:scaffold664921_cov61-Prasinocladus_malaysianus.AAC.1
MGNEGFPDVKRQAETHAVPMDSRTLGLVVEAEAATAHMRAYFELATRQISQPTSLGFSYSPC